MSPNLYLFDLDGTLVDSAPDLVAAANYVRSTQGLESLPYEELRPTASAGARGLLGASLGVKPSDENYAELQKLFLDYYAEHLTDSIALFPGVEEMIRTIESRGKQWGIVTNKPKSLTLSVLDHFNWLPATLICGDTLQRRKPFPDPIMHAMWELDAEPYETIYLGDDIRDIQAANAAGVTSLAASWGYLGCAEPIENWRADKILTSPSEVTSLELPL